MTEAAIQSEIHRVIGSRADVRLWRRNIGAARDPRTYRLIRFGFPGQADLSGIWRRPDGAGIRLEIEVKGPRGRLTDKQRQFGEMIDRLGGVYIVARSVEDVEKGLNAYARKVSAQGSLHTASQGSANPPGKPSAPPRAKEE